MRVQVQARLWMIVLVGPLAKAQTTGCEALANLDLPRTEITRVEAIGPGGFRIPNSGNFVSGANTLMRSLPEFCRVTATARPSDDSEVKIEVWMPTQNWNGKLAALGNEGWSGAINYAGLATGVASGFTAASTDTGHEGSSATFAVGHPEKLIDFGHRAVHEMTVAARAVIAEFYDGAPRHAYFVGCSAGGRQGLSEAQRYPHDYDGIVASAPAYELSQLSGMQIWASVIAHRADGAALDEDVLALVNTGVVEACDELDGVADGVIENPLLCEYDPKSFLCAGENSNQCLSLRQAETVAMLYAGPATRTGMSLFPGLARGSELGWGPIMGDEPNTGPVDVYRFLVIDDTDWDPATLEPGRDFATAKAKLGSIVDATDTDLEPFIVAGGKLLLVHGWNDPVIPPVSTIQYYEDVRDTVGPELAQSGIRLFMVPGMDHCIGGVGATSFNAVTALDRWVVTGAPPAKIEAWREEFGEILKTRPLCTYPSVASYDGSGSTDLSENFVCR